jgi:nitrate reductase alpha subunit
VTLDFRMSTTCLYSDIVLPTATWYEKNDLNTSDMHPFIHPLSAAVDPAWEARDWEIYKGFAKAFSEVCVGHLGVEKDVVLTPSCTTPRARWPSPSTCRTGSGRVRADPRQDRAADHGGRARLPQHLQALHRAGPADGQAGQRRQGHRLEHPGRGEQLGELNGRCEPGVSQGRPRIDSDIDAAEVMMMLAPETNGHVAVKAWEACQADRARAHPPGAPPRGREDPLPRHPGAAAQDHLLAHLVGLESEKVSYNAGYTNVHELIPWRTLTGRQQFYQDHPGCAPSARAS